jgi:membrane protease YdiL (CAAX protease family)
VPATEAHLYSERIMIERILIATCLTLLAAVAGFADSRVQPLLLRMPPIVGTVSMLAVAASAVALLWGTQREAVAAALPRHGASARVVVWASLCAAGTSAAWRVWVPVSDAGDVVRNLASPWSIVSAAIVAPVVAPVLEEWLLRGFVLPRLAARLNGRASVLFTALAFALARGDLPDAVPQMIGGVMLGAIMLRTGRLWLAVTVHGVINLSGPVWGFAFRLELPGRLGLVFPVACLLVAAVAAVELRRVLIDTRWRILPRSASRVAPPATWGLDLTG